MKTEFAAKTGLHSAAWDNGQQWEVIYRSASKLKETIGYEPFATYDNRIFCRKRIK